MVRRGSDFEQDAEEGDEEELPSRTDLREERIRLRDELEALAKMLARMSPRALASLGLDEGLHDELRAFAKMSKGGAHARQRRRLVQLLRAEDHVALKRRAELAVGQGRDESADVWSSWRTRLVAEGDAALEALFAEHPGADRQRVRRAVRAAIAEREAGTATKRWKELYALLVELGR